MRILFLTQIIPYPPDSGPKVKTWHVLRYLADQGHSISIISFARPDEMAHIAALRQVCTEVYTVPIHRSRLADIGYWLRSQITRRPFLIERDDLPGMRQAVRDLMARTDFDFIHADQVSMAQFALPSPKLFSRSNDPVIQRSHNAPKLVFDAHNAVWTIVQRMSENTSFFLKPVALLEARRIKRYEGMLISTFDYSLAVTDIDRGMLLEAFHSYQKTAGHPDEPSISIIPIAVDTHVLQPVESRKDTMTIVTLGTLHYPPNADGIRWFVREVFPRVLKELPQSRLIIIGKNPPRDFLDLANSQPDRITVTGFVPDLVPYLEQSAVMAVPVRAGSGMRVRILEALAQGMPIVTTTIGLEGIDAVPGHDVLVADTADDYARAVIRLLRDPELRSSLAENGRRLAEKSYDWRVVLNRMDEVYGAA